MRVSLSRDPPPPAAQAVGAVRLEWLYKAFAKAPPQYQTGMRDKLEYYFAGWKDPRKLYSREWLFNAHGSNFTDAWSVMDLSYRGKDQWGSFRRDKDSKLGVYYDDENQKVWVGFRGKLTAGTTKQVFKGKLTKTYRKQMEDVLRKYDGYEINMAGHSFGAAQMM